jgi:hypothetical protein
LVPFFFFFFFFSSVSCSATLLTHSSRELKSLFPVKQMCSYCNLKVRKRDNF